MIAAKRMRKAVITIHPDDTLAHAQALMRTHRIRHLPVLDGGRLVGLLSTHDLHGAVPLPAAPEEAQAYAEKLRALPASAVMSREVVAVAPFTPIEHCAKLMTEYKIGCLPVLEGGRLEGIVTTTDVMSMMAEMMGVSEVGSRIEVEVPAAGGATAEVARIIEGQGVSIASIAGVPIPERGRTILVMRVRTINPRPVVRALEEAGYRVPAPEDLL
jgi:acetoin utilization protein AcuB